MDGVNTSKLMYTANSHRTLVNKPLRSWALTALVVAVFACIVLCIATVTYCLYSIGELRTQQHEISAQNEQLQRRLAHVELRCQHLLLDSGGIPGVDSTETTNADDDAISWEFPDGSGSRPGQQQSHSGAFTDSTAKVSHCIDLAQYIVLIFLR